MDEALGHFRAFRHVVVFSRLQKLRNNRHSGDVDEAAGWKREEFEISSVFSKPTSKRHDSTGFCSSSCQISRRIRDDQREDTAGDGSESSNYLHSNRLQKLGNSGKVWKKGEKQWFRFFLIREEKFFLSLTLYFENPLCTKIAKSPTSCGSSCSKTVRVVIHPRVLPAENEAPMASPSVTLCTKSATKLRYALVLTSCKNAGIWKY